MRLFIIETKNLKYSATLCDPLYGIYLLRPVECIRMRIFNDRGPCPVDPATITPRIKLIPLLRRKLVILMSDNCPKRAHN